MSIAREGIKGMLPAAINLISGPGCPVCVTPDRDIDRVMDLSGKKGFVVVTFGDMLRVPGSGSSLEKERAKGADVRAVYSAMDALDICRANPDKKVIFFAIGFETTSPTIAAAVIAAKKEGLKNFFIYSSCKLIPPAMKALLGSKKVKIDGFICPGHVSVMIGSKAYDFIPKKYGIPCVVAGFEPLDILQAIYMLVRQSSSKNKKVEIQYKRCVNRNGNPAAMKALSEVFRTADAEWRGLGMIPGSGLVLRKEYKDFDAGNIFTAKKHILKKGNNACRCGDVLCGIISPDKCRLFGKRCTPDNPAGPCMVSSEGTCAAAFRYSG